MSAAEQSDRPPLVVYLRKRTSEPATSDISLRKQRRMLRRLEQDEYQIAGIYSDNEIQPPDYGWRENRPALTDALDHAAREQEARGQCQLAVLRVDGIGSGDRFAIEAFSREAQPRGVQLWGLGETATDTLAACEYAHAMNKPLPRTVATRLRATRLAQQYPEHIPIPSDGPAQIAVFVQPMSEDREARVHLCNNGTEPIRGCYEELTRGPDGPAPTARHYYRPSIDGTQRFDIEVAPGTCQWLFSFARGTWRGETDRYRLTLETGGRSLVAVLVVEGHRFEQKWRELAWL